MRRFGLPPQRKSYELVELHSGRERNEEILGPDAHFVEEDEQCVERLVVERFVVTQLLGLHVEEGAVGAKKCCLQPFCDGRLRIAADEELGTNAEIRDRLVQNLRSFDQEGLGIPLHRATERLEMGMEVRSDCPTDHVDALGGVIRNGAAAFVDGDVNFQPAERQRNTDRGPHIAS